MVHYTSVFHRGEKILKAKVCDTVLSRAKGFMFSNDMSKAKILTLPSQGKLAASIHMMFVFFPLDVYWLNSKKVIVDIKRKVRPFSLHHMPKEPAKYVLEVPSALRLPLTIGSVLDFSHSD